MKNTKTKRMLAVAALLAAWMIGDRRREGKEKRGCR